MGRFLCPLYLVGIKKRPAGRCYLSTGKAGNLHPELLNQPVQTLLQLGHLTGCARQLVSLAC